MYSLSRYNYHRQQFKLTGVDFDKQYAMLNHEVPWNFEVERLPNQTVDYYTVQYNRQILCALVDRFIKIRMSLAKDSYVHKVLDDVSKELVKVMYLYKLEYEVPFANGDKMKLDLYVHEIWSIHIRIGEYMVDSAKKLIESVESIVTLKFNL